MESFPLQRPLHAHTPPASASPQSGGTRRASTYVRSQNLKIRNYSVWNQPFETLGFKHNSFFNENKSQANNGVGAPVHGRVALSVLFPPTIRLDPDSMSLNVSISWDWICLDILLIFSDNHPPTVMSCYILINLAHPWSKLNPGWRGSRWLVDLVHLSPYLAL